MEIKKNILPAGFSESDEDYDEFGNYIERKKWYSKPLVEDFHLTLQSACITNNVPEIERALNSGSVNVNSYLQNSWTALMHAAFNGSFDAMIYLLQNGADPLIDYDYHNVVMCVCNSKVVFSISNEIDLLRCLKLVAKFDSIDINATDRHGLSALMYACSNGWLKLVKFLVNHGADIELKDNQNSETPLFFAVRFNHVDIVKFLLSRNAVKDVIDKNGQTLHGIAENKNMVDILRLLNTNNDKQLEVFYTEEHTYWDKVMDEIANGYNKDVQHFLETLSMENYIDYFNSNNITFKSLLTGTTDPTVQKAIALTPHNLNLKMGLKCFHTWYWNSYALCDKKKNRNAEDIAQTLASIVRHLHIIDASIIYLGTHSRQLDSQKYQEAQKYLSIIKVTSEGIFNELEKKPRIGHIDYMGPHKLWIRNRKVSVTDKVFVASVVILVLLRIF